MKRFDSLQEWPLYLGVFTFWERALFVGVFTFANKLQLGAAFIAGQGLGVETAVTGGFILCPAVVAQSKPGHRRIRPVVWHGSDDRVAGPALGAINEGITMSTFPEAWSIPQRSHHRYTNPVAHGSQTRWMSHWPVSRSLLYH